MRAEEKEFKLKAFKEFIESNQKEIVKSEHKLDALKSLIKKGPINIIKKDTREIDPEQILPYLSYNEMVTDEQKELIGPKRYKAMLNSFIEDLQNSLDIAPHQFEDLYISDLKGLFQEYVRSLYNIYAMTPGIKE